MFTGFPSLPRQLGFHYDLHTHPEEDEEEEEVGGDHRGDDPGGARGGFTESHIVDPLHSRVEEQATYNQALLKTVVEHMKEVDRALQALQDTPLENQLQALDQI